MLARRETQERRRGREWVIVIAESGGGGAQRVGDSGEAAEIAARPQAQGACLCPLGEVERREADPGRTRCVGRRHRWEPALRAQS